MGLNREPESIADPKDVIANAIRIARQNMPKRRRKDLTIADLYSYIGQKIELRQLSNLNSYNEFKEEVRTAYRRLHLLQ